MIQTFLLGGLMLLLSIPSFSQPMISVDGEGLITVRNNAMFKPVLHSPYSATRVSTAVRITNGERLENQSFSKFYRDSQGRTRIETPLPSLLARRPGEGRKSPPVLVQIVDSVLGVVYTLEPDRPVAHRSGAGLCGTNSQFIGVSRGLGSTPPRDRQFRSTNVSSIADRVTRWRPV